jgi:hypothetical protein
MLNWPNDLMVRRATFTSLLKIQYPMVSERTIRSMLSRKIKPSRQPGRYTAFGKTEWDCACEWIETRNRAYQTAMEQAILSRHQIQ